MDKMSTLHRYAIILAPHHENLTLAGKKIIDDHAKQTAQIVADFKTRLGQDKYESLLDLLALLDPGTDDKA